MALRRSSDVLDVGCMYIECMHWLLSASRWQLLLLAGVMRFLSAQSITILLSVWSASKGSRKGGGCHEATDHCCGNGCALSGRFHSCTDQGFRCDRCAVAPV